MATKTKPKVNVSEVLQWECPNCMRFNEGASWLRKGDEVTCGHCKCVAVVAEHYADCRPSRFEGKKAIT